MWAALWGRAVRRGQRWTKLRRERVNGGQPHPGNSQKKEVVRHPKDDLPLRRRPSLAPLPSRNLTASRNTAVDVPGVHRRSPTERLAATQPKPPRVAGQTTLRLAHCCFPGEEGQARRFAAGYLSRCVDATHFPQYRGGWAHQPHIVGCGGDGIARVLRVRTVSTMPRIVVLAPLAHPTAMLPADILRLSPQRPHTVMRMGVVGTFCALDPNGHKYRGGWCIPLAPGFLNITDGTIREARQATNTRRDGSLTPSRPPPPPPLVACARLPSPTAPDAAAQGWGWSGPSQHDRQAPAQRHALGAAAARFACGCGRDPRRGRGLDPTGRRRI